MPQGMHIERPTAVVRLGNPGCCQVTVKCLHQLPRNEKQRRIGWEPVGNRLAAFVCLGLQSRQLVGEPLPQVLGQVGAKRPVADFFAVLKRRPREITFLEERLL